jgi:hypothetical protein
MGKIRAWASCKVKATKSALVLLIIMAMLAISLTIESEVTKAATVMNPSTGFDVRLYNQALAKSETVALAGSSSLSNDSYSLQFHIYRNLDEVTRDLRPFIRPGDSFTINASSGLWDGVRRDFQLLKSTFPGHDVHFRTQGWNNVRNAIRTMPDDLVKGFASVQHTYEPGDENAYGPYPPQGPHYFPYVLNQYRQVADLARDRGIVLWAVPSGRYVPVVGLC